MREQHNPGNNSTRAGIRTSAAVLLVCGLLTALLSTSYALAHELRPTIIDLNSDGASVSLTVRVNLEALLAEIGPEHDDSDDAPNAQIYNRLRALSAEELEITGREQLTQSISEWQLKSSTDEIISLSLVRSEVPPTGDVRVARDSTLILQGTLPPGTDSLIWSWPAGNGPAIVRAGAADSPDSFSQYVVGGDSSDAISVSSPASRSLWQTAVDYVKVGFVHIVPKGMDHILFVIGLFLLSAHWRPLLWQVTGFTLAHSVTLALGVTGVLQLPATIVEPLIALSIVAVCLENLFQDRLSTRRTALVFAFGLLHGLGFAGVLSDIGLDTNELLVSLLSFNVGVELGQILVILLCMLLIGLPFRKRSWYRSRITKPLSIVIGAVGMYWFITRVFG